MCAGFFKRDCMTVSVTLFELLIYELVLTNLFIDGASLTYFRHSFFDICDTLSHKRCQFPALYWMRITGRVQFHKKKINDLTNDLQNKILLVLIYLNKSVARRSLKLMIIPRTILYLRNCYTSVSVFSL